MGHEIQQLLGAYVLGALEPDERRALEAHLQGCTECQNELAEYQQVSEGLLHVARPNPPDAGLRARLAKRIGRPDGVVTSQLRRPSLGRALPFAIGGLGVLLLAVNAGLFFETRKLARRGEELLAQQQASQTALALASYPDSRTTLVHQETIRGTFVYEPNSPVAVLNAWGLPPLPRDQTYQLWLVNSDGTRSSGALFTPDESQAFVSILVRSSIPLGEVLGFGVTIEPGGGSPEPTGRRVLGADLEHTP